MAYRRTKGLSRKALARRIGIDPDTLGKWERDESKPKGRFKRRFDLFIGVSGPGSRERAKRELPNRTQSS